MLGAYTISLFATLTVVPLGVLLGVRWLGGWINILMAGLVGVILIFVLEFYPVSKLLWLALDLLFRPPIERDFEDDGA